MEMLAPWRRLNRGAGEGGGIPRPDFFAVETKDVADSSGRDCSGRRTGTYLTFNSYACCDGIQQRDNFGIYFGKDKFLAPNTVQKFLTPFPSHSINLQTRTADLARGWPTYRARVMHYSRGRNPMHCIIGCRAISIRSRDQKRSCRDKARITPDMLIYARPTAKLATLSGSPDPDRDNSTAKKLTPDNTTSRGTPSALGGT
ncbi:hypothetical protein BHE74_00033328 [Ensete ventricosum]|nr:hypothetical protein BHE74_00033328 [Ensete ventricosum]